MVHLQIEKLVNGGAGLARTSGGVVLIEGVLPGEIVAAEIIAATSGMRHARIVEILQSSTCRRPEICPSAHRCGGCDWQHIAYDQQLACKRGIFLDCLTRIGKIRPDFAIDIFPSPQWRYRCRAQLKVDHQTRSFGFFRKASAEIVDVPECPVLIDSLNRILKHRRQIVPTLDPSVRQVKVIGGVDGVASRPVLGGYTRREAVMMVKSMMFEVPGGGFFQGNIHLLGDLGSWALPWIGGDMLADIYGGAGFFSVMLSAHFKRGVLIESEAGLCSAAEANFRRNGLSGYSARCMSAEARSTWRKIGQPDCAVIDPPRPGLAQQAREGLRRLLPPTIVSISCNPSTHARDIAFFIEKCGYEIRRAALFDLYPQTHHIETAVVLGR